MAGHIIVSDEGATRTIVMRRPEKKNALTPEMFLAMGEAINSAQSNPDIRSLTLTGRSMTGLSSSEGSSSVTGHPRMRPTGSSFPSSEQDARSMRIRKFRAHGFGPKTKG